MICYKLDFRLIDVQTTIIRLGRSVTQQKNRPNVKSC